jgi:hypothetical protein
LHAGGGPAGARQGKLEHAPHTCGATIAVMAKFKPFKGKAKNRPAPQGGISCLILVISAMFLVMFFLYYVMKNANG